MTPTKSIASAGQKVKKNSSPGPIGFGLGIGPEAEGRGDDDEPERARTYDEQNQPPADEAVREIGTHQSRSWRWRSTSNPPSRPASQL